MAFDYKKEYKEFYMPLLTVEPEQVRNFARQESDLQDRRRGRLRLR